MHSIAVRYFYSKYPEHCRPITTLLVNIALHCSIGYRSSIQPHTALEAVQLIVYKPSVVIAVCNKDGDATFLGRNQKFENLLLCAL